MLIAARALLGLAGATLAPSTSSLIRSMFLDSRQRTFAIGVWITSFSAGAAIGPVLGGLLPEFRDPRPGASTSAAPCFRWPRCSP
jgi:MFS transporter, DHA2 family, multidrug resistance protein